MAAISGNTLALEMLLHGYSILSIKLLSAILVLFCFGNPFGTVCFSQRGSVHCCLLQHTPDLKLDTAGLGYQLTSPKLTQIIQKICPNIFLCTVYVIICRSTNNHTEEVHKIVTSGTKQKGLMCNLWCFYIFVYEVFEFIFSRLISIFSPLLFSMYIKFTDFTEILFW